MKPQIKNTKRLGLIQVYTGDGKGKTTAALGLALRAVGHNLKVYMIQFMKEWPYGEVKAAQRLKPNLTIVQFGRKEFVNKDNPDPKDIELAKKGLKHAEEIIKSGKYDIVILDEINIAVAWNLIPLEEALKVINQKPLHVELILTGRYAPKEFIEIADLVTEFKEIKHPYRLKGITARPGIEY